MSFNIPVFTDLIYTPVASPCHSDRSSSSSFSSNSLSSTRSILKSKRGRKAKNWYDEQAIKNKIDSAKTIDERNKIKNNVSSGQYRKRKADEREELEKIAFELAKRGERLQRAFDRNIEWFKKAKVLFPDIQQMPW